MMKAVGWAAILLPWFGGAPGAGDDLEALLERARAAGLVTSIEELPTLRVLEEDNAYLLYRDLIEFSRADQERILEAYPVDASVEDAAKALEELKEFFGVVEQAARRPHYVPPQDATRSQLLPLSALSGMKNAARLLFFRTRVLADLGKSQDALEDFENLTSVLRHSYSGQTIIDMFNLRAINAWWVLAAERVAWRGLDDVDALKRLFEISKLAPIPDYRPALWAEMAIARRTIQQIADGEHRASDFDVLTDEFSEQLDALIAAAAPSIEAPLVRFHIEVAEAWDDHKAVVRIDQAYEHSIEDTVSNPANLLARLLYLPVSNYHRSALQIRAVDSTARIGMAAALLRARHGSWPTLDEAAELAGAQPIDPFSKTRFVYKADGESLVIYGLGPNGVDNEGARRMGRSEDYDVGVFRIGR